MFLFQLSIILQKNHNFEENISFINIAQNKDLFTLFNHSFFIYEKPIR